MLFISNIVSDVIKNAVKVGEANNALLEHFSVEKFDECPCCMEELCYTQVEGLCGHRLCLKCYGLLGKKTCPLCRADYKDINKPWYREMVDVKNGIGSLSFATYEKDEEEYGNGDEINELHYECWKETVIGEAVSKRLDELHPKRIADLVASYGNYKAMYEYIDRFGQFYGKQSEKKNGVLCFTEEFSRALLYFFMTEKMCGRL